MQRPRSKSTLIRFAVCLVTAAVAVTGIPSHATSATDITLRPIPPPEDLPLAPWTVRDAAPMAAGLLLVAAAALLALVRRRHQHHQPLKVSAHAAALAELRRLAALNLIDSGAAAEFYHRVSRVVRRYADDRFGFHATRQTTDELLADPLTTKRLAADDRRWLSEFLHQCDPVKYGHLRPSPHGPQALVASACRFVEVTSADGASSLSP